MKRVEMQFYRILISVVRDGVKYDSFMIDSDNDLQVLFHCHRQFFEVRTHELLGKFGDVVSISGESNQNHQSVAIATTSSSTHIVASSSVFIIAPATVLVASSSFAADLNCNDIGEIGDNQSFCKYAIAMTDTPVMISISREVGEPNTVEDVLQNDDDVDLSMIDKYSDDDLEKSIPVRSSGTSSLGTQHYLPHFLTLNLEAMTHGFPNVESKFRAKDTQDTTGLVEFQVGQQFRNKEEVFLCVKTYGIRRGVKYRMPESDIVKYYRKYKEFENYCRR
ncbi:uncharacterized protein LOC130983091 [Arachis stenosperma]|uniref:uncharacterized protein LOC130983091 n=1 Tax=Arachis stenosperma TaxID=217475 RepID=UPI0025ABD2B4|nr:uncharacterized protein LOC130983091 [Arachis stenosperma]